MNNERFAVIGLGYIGTSIAKKLAERGAEVLAIDADHEKVEEVKTGVAHAVVMSGTDSRALKAQNIQDMDAVVVAIGHNFEGLILTTVLLKELGTKRIIARSQNDHQKMILKKLGIEEIFSPDEQVGSTVAEMLLHPTVEGFLPLPDDYEIIEVKTPKRVANKSIEEIGLRERYNLNLVTIKRTFSEMKDGKLIDVEHIIGVPKGDTILLDTDIIIILGKTFDVDKFIEVNE
ncbi:MAG: TrkA family potassium uptake protein [Cyclobacteriaceae bacterium]